MKSFTILENVGKRIVEEADGSLGGKSDESIKQLSARGAIVDEQLDSCIGALEHSRTAVSCFGRKSSGKQVSQAVTVLERERQNLRRVLNDIVDIVRTQRSETDELSNRLAEAEQALLAARMPQGEELVESLQKQVEALQAENSELQKTTLKLTRTRDLTSARLKELTYEYQGIAEKAELELRRLESELAKAEEARDVAIAENLDKVREIRNFQKRYDTLKIIAESHREAAMAAKKQAEETASGHAKALEVQARRVTEARAGREVAVAELEALQREHAALHDAFIRAGGVEYQIAIIRKASFSRSSAGAANKGGSGSGTRGTVRTLLKGRQGWCVHARACGSAGAAAGDMTRLTPLTYDSQASLEALIERQELFLCPTCLVNGSFRTL
ncbi:hypothetical protein Vafri_17814 [Volvox africanus]|uniref:Uncharacterized protein n=1 Tax=Volvox africanus TaxID=51714 RepID=A0A8J4BLC9_9CHLO|nr:hypothetical protein Vafri_17814 [Volvox africanus]